MTKVELKTVSELHGKRFIVPLYQRGYRWEAQQVKDLLEDIDGFMQNQKTHENESKDEGGGKSVSAENDDFYCLQPLAVKETVINKDDFLNQLPRSTDVDVLFETPKAIDNSVCWEVIDGQQRLTTIFIILYYLVESEHFQIQFERWKSADVEENTDVISVAVSKIVDNLKKNSEYQNEESIDLWHICNAYKEIDQYFKNSGPDRSSAKYKTDFRDTLLNKVQFIWYESDDENPIKVFTRLNIGKIALTNSELVKALFLNRSNFADSDFEKIRLRQTEIATRWDEIESTLQNDEFWMFIHEPGFSKPTRIDFIFDLVCELGRLDEFFEDEMKKDERIGKDKYRTFRYFNEYFHSKKATEKASENHVTLIEQCWQTVDSVFAAFREWFDDLTFYHYVGFLVACGCKIKEILKSWMEDKCSKGHFIKWLKEKITKKILECNNLDQTYEFNTNDSKRQCRPLLLLHNIQTVINQNTAETIKYDVATFYKFPFHLYKAEVWNVEHVDSNTENSLAKDKDKKEWLKSAWCFLRGEGELKGEILKYFKPNENDSEGRRFEELYEEICTKINSGKVNKLDENAKNSVSNFVLLDESTNKSYGNSIFPVKKMILLGKSHGVQYKFEDDKEDGKLIGFKVVSVPLSNKENVMWKTAFVPPITQRVFLKAFNPVSNNPWSWDVEDAKAYRENIYETLKEFGVKQGVKQPEDCQSKPRTNNE